jgi:hypothetical protein
MSVSTLVRSPETFARSIEGRAGTLRPNAAEQRLLSIATP